MSTLLWARPNRADIAAGSGMGRPREFNQIAALQAATECFWQYGYEATSMRDLATSMGLTAPSLYNAFGDKQALFAQALEHYLACTTRDRLGRYESSLPPKEAIRRFFAEIVDHSIDDRERKGCFLENSAPSSLNNSARSKLSSKGAFAPRRPTERRRAASMPKIRRACCSGSCSASACSRALLPTARSLRASCGRRSLSSICPIARGISQDDRSPLLDNPERPQDHDLSGRERVAVSCCPGQHQQGRSVQAGVLGDLPEQPDTGNCRS